MLRVFSFVLIIERHETEKRQTLRRTLVSQWQHGFGVQEEIEVAPPLIAVHPNQCSVAVADDHHLRPPRRFRSFLNGRLRRRSLPHR